MAHLIFFAEFSFAQKASPILFATDAMGSNDEDSTEVSGFGGFGIVGLEVSDAELIQCWSASFHPGHSIAKLDGTLSTKRISKKSLAPTVPFTRLPPSIFKPKWTTLASGRWKWNDHITAGESRTHFKLIQNLASCAALHDRRFIVLQDNAPTAAAYNKGRATSSVLNYYCRRRAAHTIAAQITTAVPWVESVLMPADDASRFQDGSKPDGSALPGQACEIKDNHSKHDPVSEGASKVPRVHH